AWVQFNLGSFYPISKITVFARDAFGARLNNAQIFTSVNDMSQKMTNQLNADPNVNVISPINNLVNFPYGDPTIPVQKVDFQFLLQNIIATETVSGLSNSTNATVNNNGTSGNDTIVGGDADDHIDGGEGSDSISGGLGDDYLSGGQGSDTINGDDGFDMVSYREFNTQNQTTATTGVIVNLSSGTATNGTATDNWGNTDTLLSIEAVEGSDFNDSIVGSIGNEFLFGSQGNDTITGGGGSDHLQGGEGDDSITGGNGDDFISGDQGNDILIGGGGSDHIQGGEGSDLITAVGAGDNFLSGDQGNDSISGGDGSDNIQGGDGDDSITGGSGDDFISGGAGIDTLTGGNGNDIFALNLGSQSISSSNVTDVITDFARGSDKIDFGISSSVIQFVSQTSVVSNLAALLTTVNGINDTAPNKTDGKILFYFGVVASDGYLVTEDDAGVINNIIKLSGVGTIASTDIVGI
ncbi:MAG: hypothetical protein RL755_2041, partial [Pseudomonadota bacterium]